MTIFSGIVLSQQIAHTMQQTLTRHQQGFVAGRPVGSSNGMAGTFSRPTQRAMPLGRTHRCRGTITQAKAPSDAVMKFAPALPGQSDDTLECPSIRDKLTPRYVWMCNTPQIRATATGLPRLSSTTTGAEALVRLHLHHDDHSHHHTVSEDDRVALQSLKFASPESAGATCVDPEGSTNGNGAASWLEASVESLCVPLPAWAMRAGARETIYFNPAETTVAVVTCGGLCPGLNDVVQGLVKKCLDYGVPESNILGIRCVSLQDDALVAYEYILTGMGTAAFTTKSSSPST